MNADAAAVLDFWFGTTDAIRPMWFQKNDAVDADIRTRFGATIERGLVDGLADWGEHTSEVLARIIVLDQFTRNAFRDTPRAFAGDAAALANAVALVGAGRHTSLPPLRRWFVYLPFEHAESLPLQDQAVRLFIELQAEAPQLGEALDYARRHRDAIARFGRFPHRNAVLGRSSTDAELAFLQQPGSRF